MQNYSVMHWSSLLKRGKEVINVAMPVLPTLVSNVLAAIIIVRIRDRESEAKVQ